MSVARVTRVIYYERSGEVFLVGFSGQLFGRGVLVSHASAGAIFITFALVGNVFII